MSHIVEITTEVRDRQAVDAACRRLGLEPPLDQTVHLFNGSVAGLTVTLPGWRYPVVCDTVGGTLRYDNFAGRWGDSHELDRFLQAYAVEKARLEAHKQGYSVTEDQLADGSIRLSVLAGGGA